MAYYKSKVSANARSYYSGMGYAIAHEKRGINFKDDKSRAIFKKGYNAGKRRAAKNPLKYPKIATRKKKGSKK